MPLRGVWWSSLLALRGQWGGVLNKRRDAWGATSSCLMIRTCNVVKYIIGFHSEGSRLLRGEADLFWDPIRGGIPS